MNKLFLSLVLTLLWVAVPAEASATDLVIVNGRIIIGNGQVIEKGYVVVRDGRIVSIAAGAPPSSFLGTKVDATGMTVVAGYIDCHRHLLQPPDKSPSPLGYSNVDNLDEFLTSTGGAASAMRDLLEAGFTTVVSGSDDNAGVLKLKKLIETGQIQGPRLITSASVASWLLPDEASVRAAVDAAYKTGADSIAEIPYPRLDQTYPFNPSEQESKNFAAAIDESKKLGILAQVHATSPEAMTAAAKLGVTRFVHTAYIAWMTDAQAQTVKDAGAMVASSTNGPGAVFNVFSHDNKPASRAGVAWPEGKALAGKTISPAAQVAVRRIVGERGRNVAYGVINLRTLYDNGVEVAFSGDGSPYTGHTPYQQAGYFANELKTLNLLFSPEDMIAILGKNSAEWINHGVDRGTIERGKLGDLVILRGNPLEGYWNFLKPVVVIKDGIVVVDHMHANQAKDVRGR